MKPSIKHEGFDTNMKAGEVINCWMTETDYQAERGGKFCVKAFTTKLRTHS
jgi:hypothetical protein